MRLVLAYDGTDFRGFARQPESRTVQGVLEEALGLVLGTVPRISVAGRTDAGVHAEGRWPPTPGGDASGASLRSASGSCSSCPSWPCWAARSGRRGFRRPGASSSFPAIRRWMHTERRSLSSRWLARY